MAEVKQAAPEDFPRLVQEWETVFQEDDSSMQDRRFHALRWLCSMWIVKDTDGFLKAATGSVLNHSYPGAQALVRLKPEKAAELLFSPGCGRLNEFFARDAVQELARHNPALYLKMDPHGMIEVTPGFSSWDRDWFTAVASLAKTDPMAAGNACLGWDFEQNDPRSINRALLAVASAWKTIDPTFKEWVDRIANPQLRNLATHARLCALAEKDPKAALVELYSAKPEPDNGLDEDAPRTILTQLAKADFVEALKLLKDVERIFAKYPHDSFAEPSPEEKAERTANPFSHLSPGRYSGGDEVENNGVRFSVLAAGADKLPDDPLRLFEALHQLRAEMGSGDSAWQRGVEAWLIRLKSDRWSADSCLAAAKLRVEDLHGERDDPTLQKLAAGAAHGDPNLVLNVLNQLPESVRPAFAGEIIKALPALDPNQRIALFSHLTAAQWDKAFGQALGKNPGDYAPVIASLPGERTLGARKSFMEQWGEQDPEAAAQWLASLPADAASKPSAAGLAAAWASYDAEAACAWASTLKAGPALDGAAASLADILASYKPDEAWHWASKVSDPKTRAEAFYDVAYQWRSKAPEEFRAAYAAARRAVGLPILEHGTNPFE